MSEDKPPSHHPGDLSRHDEYTEAKERLTKLAEQFHFELAEFRQTWTSEPDVENATRQVVSQWSNCIKRAEDGLDRAYKERKGKQKECAPVADVGPGNEAPMSAIHRDSEAPHIRMISAQNRSETETTGAPSSARPELRSFFIEVIGDWNKQFYVRYHNRNGGLVRRNSPTPQPQLASQENKRDQLRRRVLKAGVAARNDHSTKVEVKKHSGPAPASGYQWTKRYNTPPPRFAELNKNQGEPVQNDCSNTNRESQRGVEAEVEFEEDFDEDFVYESDDGIDGDEIPTIDDEGLHQIPNTKRSREDDDDDGLGEEKEEGPQPELKKARLD